MALRYWVGGTGTWDNVNTANWSTSSGGSGGASVPGSSDTVIIDSNSGGGTVTFQNYSATAYAGLNVTAGTLNISATLRIDGSVIFGSGATIGGFSAFYIWPGYGGIGKTVNFSCSTSSSIYSLDFIAGNGSTINCSGTIRANNLYYGCRYGTTNVINLTNIVATGGVIASSSYAPGGTVNFSSSTIANRFDSRGAGTGTLTLGFNSSSNLLITGNGTSYFGGQYINSFKIGNLQITTSNPHTFVTYDTSKHRIEYFDSWYGSTVKFSNAFYCDYFRIGYITGTPSTVSSITAGVPVTVTAALGFNLENVSFKDITAAGSIPFEGTGLVDLGGNTNITFGGGSGLFFGSNF